MYALALLPARIGKSEPGDPRGSLLRDDFQRLHYTWNDFMFDPRILTFSIFAADSQVHAGIARGQGRQVAYGTEVGKKLKLLAQSHIDAGKPAADRRCYWPFQAQPGALDRLRQLLGNVFAILGKRFRARGKSLPF